LSTRLASWIIFHSFPSPGSPDRSVTLERRVETSNHFKGMSLSAVERFAIPYSSSSVEDLRNRLQRTRWPDEIPNSNWTYGFDLNFLADLCSYWSDHFDWKAQVDRISAFNHFKFQADEGKIHFIHEKGKGPSPIPIILTHGWPGSFAEMLEIIPLLTDPAAHGFDTADSFDVIVPSLPGFGFSDRPAKGGMNAFRVAQIWVELMDALGYDRFAAQGGDLGAGVSTALGLRHSEHMVGIHLNFIPGSYRPHIAAGTTITTAEQEFAAKAAQWYDQNGAYAHLQGTRPQSPSYALNDSPAGLAAWIIEKFREWSDCGGDLYSRFSRDEVLTNVTLYWMTETISSSFRMYYEGRRVPLHFAEGEFVHPPCAIACFPKEINIPPRTWVERGYNVQRWTEMPRGGHFAATEEPEQLAADMRAFFRTLRA
jgi:pimeloyl-ACP methyl ester carboxylesterase